MRTAIRRLQSPVVRFAILAFALALATALDASNAGFEAAPSPPVTHIPTPERSVPDVTTPAKNQVIDWFNGASWLSLRCSALFHSYYHTHASLLDFNLLTSHFSAGLPAKYQRLITIILCTIMMLTGIFFVLFGYRIFRVRINSF